MELPDLVLAVLPQAWARIKKYSVHDLYLEPIVDSRAGISAATFEYRTDHL
ncbi:hypothetical protein [Persicobacter psychrovividus]|uniref:Uncharacterized protein n=1 Tax=Persicobacter psychrovividus TaxID=387638 RepID=A0ABM7VJ72_9BACT|nr:hypothetical protein PEPS_32950 [Persicobacter psychrovividus]